MAIATPELVAALRTTALRLEQGATYQWTHMGACNCGHLAQTLTRIDRAEIHRLALERAGDWSEQGIDYCPASGLPIDDVITTMLDAGLELRDLGELERLSASDVLAQLPVEERQLERRERAHVVRYMRAWADMLEARIEARERELRGERSGVHERALEDAPAQGSVVLRRAG